MDAKTRASFVNSVGGGGKVPCPKCNTLNEAGSSFCMLCGAKLAEETPVSSSAPFAPAEPAPEAPAAPAAVPFAPAEPAPAATPFAAVKEVQPAAVQAAAARPVPQAEEPESVFAEGLPDWDVVPPQVMVRRKKGK